eukprot:Seg4063.1 transcript_id=Seg4063.1/GoldUCD/mRNA.D3Y31 product="von Willebrand factor A domain-containing protein 5A" protein_id=Seg4063.1/GoldUCD/D3Y31
MSPIESKDEPSGLYGWIENHRIPIPLKKVSVKARVIGFVAEVCIEQKYINEESVPIEVAYSFPTEEGAAVVEFTANVDGRIIQSEAKEKMKAKKEYEDAKKANKTAVLLEQDRPDIFNIQIGQLKSNAEAVITMKYVTELPVDNGMTRLTIPTTIAPRHCPPKNTCLGSTQDDSSSEIPKIPYSQSSPAPLDVEVTVIMKSRIKNISSPSHNICNEEGGSKFSSGSFIAKTSLAGGNITEMDRDFIVLIACDDTNRPVAFVEESQQGYAVVMVSFIPCFQVQEDPKEVIFLVDRSGSMSGSSINEAKLALEYFIRSLPTNCFFNIVSFGNDHSFLFKDGSKKYNEQSMKDALGHVEKMTANMGGTDIFSPLEAIFNQVSNSGLLRQIIVLTDGEVSNEDSILRLVRKHEHLGRVFSLGIGAAASRYLVNGLARAGGGTAVFSTYGEDLRPKVLQLLKNALLPHLREVKLWWQDRSGYAVDEKNVPDAPTKVEPLHDGSRMLVYRKFDASKIPTAVTVTAEGPDGSFSHVIQISKNDTCDFPANILHRLAARKLIEELEEGGDGDGAKKIIINVATKYHLASKYTSFVGVDDACPEECFQGTKKIQIPNQIAYGYMHATAPPMPLHSLSWEDDDSIGNFEYYECVDKLYSLPPPSHLRRSHSPPICDLSPMSFGSQVIDDDSSDFIEYYDVPPPSHWRCAATPAPIYDSPSTKYDSAALYDLPPAKYGSTATTPASPKDDLTLLLDQQSFEGAFSWSVIFQKLTAKTQDEILSTKPTELASFCQAGTTIEDSAATTATTIWLTAIAIQLMKLKMQDKSVLWELVVNKSMAYLRKILKEDQLVVFVLNKAKTLVEI